MTDRDSTATTPATVSTAPTVELDREGQTAQVASAQDQAAQDQAARDQYVQATHDPYAQAPASASVVAAGPRKPWYRRTGGIIGLAAVALLLLGLIFGAGFAAGSLSANVFGQRGDGPGTSGGFGPQGGDGGPGGMPGRDSSDN